MAFCEMPARPLHILALIRERTDQLRATHRRCLAETRLPCRLLFFPAARRRRCRSRPSAIKVTHARSSKRCPRNRALSDALLMGIRPLTRCPMRAVKTALSVVALSLLLAGCGDSAKLPEQASTGSNPPLPEPTKSFIPDRQHRARQGLAGGRASRRRPPGLAVTAFAGRARSSALALCAAERRRAGRRNQRAAAGPTTARASRAGS